VRQAAPLFESAVGRNVRIDLDLASGLPLVEGDPEQIDQVLLNLVTNASEAIGPGRGSITITTRREAITAPRGGDPQRLDGPDSTRVVLEVRDDGPGMDEETARRAFDPFFSTKFTGRGLGLAAVSGIVKAHHGEIDLRSAPGLGTRIHITLPAVPGDEAPEDPRGASLAPAVLVIDDEDDLLAVARAVLERAGYDVLTERRAENAIETFRRRRADLVAVVLDLSMPDVTGERALQELRRIEERVPVILSSGYAESEALRRLEGARVEAFLAKPYPPESLLDVVRKVERVLPER
jgi:two-component system, cell cycle sensor histidine kinase and response regulator CckA